jgi:hypothetical protein
VSGEGSLGQGKEVSLHHKTHKSRHMIYPGKPKIEKDNQYIYQSLDQIQPR